jgi:hypothetical protein
MRAGSGEAAVFARSVNTPCALGQTVASLEQTGRSLVASDLE